MAGRSDAKQASGGMDVAKYAARAIDSYEGNKRYMGADDARRATPSAVAAVQRDESGLKGEDARRFEASAFKVAQSVLNTYASRIEEGYPAGRARVDAVRIAAGWYDGQGEPRQAYGTLDVAKYAARTIDEYRHRAELRGRLAARQSTVYAASGTAEAAGINVTRAARVADASIAEYERLSAKGAPHELARAGAIRRTAERYDQHAQDRQRQQARDRGGMER